MVSNCSGTNVVAEPPRPIHPGDNHSVKVSPAYGRHRSLAVARSRRTARGARLAKTPLRARASGRQHDLPDRVAAVNEEPARWLLGRRDRGQGRLGLLGHFPEERFLPLLTSHVLQLRQQLVDFGVLLLK
jgi:hypothetical protein